MESKSMILEPREYYVYCKNLGLDPSASWKEIKLQGSNLLKQYHSDQVGYMGDQQDTKIKSETKIATDDVLQVINFSFTKLKAHNAAVSNMNNEELLALVASHHTKDKVTPHNKARSRFLFAYLLNNATDIQLEFLCGHAQFVANGFWNHSELVASLPRELIIKVIKEKSAIVWDGIFDNYQLVKSLLINRVMPHMEATSHYRGPPQIKDLLFQAYLGIYYNQGSVSKETMKYLAHTIQLHKRSESDVIVNDDDGHLLSILRKY